MHYNSCQNSLRSSERVKCGNCESRSHVNCVASPKEMEGGDRGYQWKCAVCQHPAGKCRSHSHVLLNTINHMTEKFELVNKVQLPKLNSDLLLLKSATDRIEKQNEDILKKIDQLQKTSKRKTVEPNQPVGQNRSHRRRTLNLTKKTTCEDNEEMPMLSASEKCTRYKSRRRSYHLYKVFLLVNRKLLRTRSPRNKQPR